MTQAQERHLADIKAGFLEEVDRKYRAGQKEHGGNLWDRDCLREIPNEAVDLYTYIHTAREQDNKLRLIVYNWNSGTITDTAAKIQIKQLLGIQ